MKRVLFFLPILIACGRSNYAGFESYVQAFEAQAAEHGRPLTVTSNIRFVEEQETVGYCSWGIFNKKDITIVRSGWDKMGEYEREMVIFHELGHCELGRKHLDNTLMQFPSISLAEYLGDRADLLTELFAD